MVVYLEKASVRSSLRDPSFLGQSLFSLAVANTMATRWPYLLAVSPSPHRLAILLCAPAYREQLTVGVVIGVI